MIERCQISAAHSPIVRAFDIVLCFVEEWLIFVDAEHSEERSRHAQLCYAIKVAVTEAICVKIHVSEHNADERNLSIFSPNLECLVKALEVDRVETAQAHRLRLVLVVWVRKIFV